MKRKAISKKIRFEVFKRDSFTCQYCGAHPPKVILHVDHIDPVANGGGNDIDNLITSCEPCNLGKGARKLSDVPKSLKNKAKDITEAEEQIKGYNNVLAQKARRIEADAWKVAAALEGKPYVERFNRENFLSIKKFIERLPTQEVVDAAEIAFSKMPWSNIKAFKYFCGICWVKIREFEHE